MQAAVARVGKQEVERRPLRDVEQRAELRLAFRVPVNDLERVLEIVADVLIEFLVFLFLHLRA